MLFWVVGLSAVVADVATKQIAVSALSRAPVPVVGDWLMFKLVYNPGAAFGIHVGAYSRIVFMVLAIVALVVLGAMAYRTPPTQWFRLTALGLVCGGAVGNLLDRIRSPRGVVDFIDVYIGSFHWPTFNLADIAVTCGALALAATFWYEGRQIQEASRAGESADAAEA
jgi:signal peptidase II